jgi:hypothetical protein
VHRFDRESGGELSDRRQIGDVEERRSDSVVSSGFGYLRGYLTSGVEPADVEDDGCACSRQRAVCTPMPEVAPVTMARRPDRLTSARRSAAVDVNPNGVSHKVIEISCHLSAMSQLALRRRHLRSE